MEFNLRYSRYNERSILIEWPSKIDEIILNSILDFKKTIETFEVKQKVEIFHAYNSILIIYEYTIENFNDRVLDLKRLFKNNQVPKKIESKTWEIPICYDDEFAVDLDDFSLKNGLPKNEIINLHSNSIYTVYFTGFLPGFLYLGGLNPQLHFKRKSKPSLNVKQGSVGIGGQQTGIYPQDSPGGWHIIGKTPIELFNPFEYPPCHIKSGDKLKFKPIDKPEFFDIKSQIENFSFQLKSTANDA